MSDTRRPLTVDEFELLVSQVIIPNRWKGAEPLTERQIRKVGNNAHWENVLVEVSQVTRDNYLHHIRTWWAIRDAHNATVLTKCPEANRYCKPGLDGSLCDEHQELANEQAA